MKNRIYTEDIIGVVTLVTGVAESDLISESRARAHTDARRICYKLIREYVHSTLNFIARRFQRKANATIGHAIRTHDDYMNTDPEYAFYYNLCKDFTLNKDGVYNDIDKDYLMLYYKNRVEVLTKENNKLRGKLGLVKNLV